MALANYKSALCNQFSGQISQISSTHMAKYSQLQKQHNEFVAHIEAKIQQLQQQQQMMSAMPQLAMQGLPMVLPNQIPNQTSLQFDAQPPPARPPLPFEEQTPHQFEHSVQMFVPLNASQSTPTLLPQMPIRMAAVSQSFSGPPVSAHFAPSMPPNAQFFNSSQMAPKEVIPDVPYYELPAGLMAPLVKLEDFEYKPITPADIRLPPPAPPNERLLQAVDAFYAPPTHERPRNSDGWEQLGLYEFFKAKSHAKREKDIANNAQPYHSTNNNTNMKHHTTNQPNSKRNQNNANTHGSPPSHAEHRSASPSSHKRRYREDKRSRSRSKSNSRSRSKSYSPDNYRHRSRSRSRSRSSSPTNSYSNSDTKLDDTNKGYQMLTKMGWNTDSGLGAQQQGIQDPVSAADVRNKYDQYKGVGNQMNDPFEKFRKNKGQAFMQRISQSRSTDK